MIRFIQHSSQVMYANAALFGVLCCLYAMPIQAQTNCTLCGKPVEEVGLYCLACSQLITEGDWLVVVTSADEQQPPSYDFPPEEAEEPSSAEGIGNNHACYSKSYKCGSLAQYLAETLNLQPIQPKVLLIGQLGIFARILANLLARLRRMATAADLMSRLIESLQCKGYLEQELKIDQLQKHPGLYLLKKYSENSIETYQESLIIQVTAENMFLMTETGDCFQIYESTLNILANLLSGTDSVLLIFSSQ